MSAIGARWRDGTWRCQRRKALHIGMFIVQQQKRGKAKILFRNLTYLIEWKKMFL